MLKRVDGVGSGFGGGGNTPACAVRRTPQAGRRGTSACGCPPQSFQESRGGGIESAEDRRGLNSPVFRKRFRLLGRKIEVCPTTEQTAYVWGENAIVVPFRGSLEMEWGESSFFDRFRNYFFRYDCFYPYDDHSTECRSSDERVPMVQAVALFLGNGSKNGQSCLIRRGS